MEIRCQLAALSVWLLPEEYLLKRKKVHGKEWSQEESWAQGLEEQVQTVSGQMGVSSGERKWLSV